MLLILPRLKDWDVLGKAIAGGLTNPEWDVFEYTITYDVVRRYGGLYFRGSGQKPSPDLLEHRFGFLVKPQLACARPGDGSGPADGG